MLCIFCGSKTLVFNSRHQKKTNTTWRRRQCLNCAQTTTTTETIDLSKALLVADSQGRTTKFSSDSLFLSIYECCKHRVNPVEDARGLTDTVTAKLMKKLLDSTTTTATIVKTTTETLNRFDKVAGVQYKALNRRRTR